MSDTCLAPAAGCGGAVAVHHRHRATWRAEPQRPPGPATACLYLLALGRVDCNVLQDLEWPHAAPGECINECGPGFVFVQGDVVDFFDIQTSAAVGNGTVVGLSKVTVRMCSPSCPSFSSAPLRVCSSLFSYYFSSPPCSSPHFFSFSILPF